MAEKIDPWKDEGIVKIKPKAYMTMVKHVLTYGNEGLADKSVEVMGVCMGKQEGNDIIVYEAIPISHGNAIEVGFTPADYAAFAQVDEEYSNRGDGLYACGWYHSHPRMKAFFSKVDIKNHLFYQKEQTPKGFGLVFDHEYFDEPGHPGYLCFRLDDYHKGVSSDFHESKSEVIPPDDLDSYREIMYLIEAYQEKKPFIKEIGGLDVDDSVWDFSEDEEESKEKEPEKIEKSPLDEIKEGYKEGMEEFSKEFTMKFLEAFDKFKSDTTKATQKGASVMINVLADMKDIVSDGVGRVKQYLEEILNSEVENVQNSVEEMFKKFDADMQEFNKKFNEFSSKISEGLGDLLKEAISDKLDVAMKIINDAAKNAENISSQAESFKENLNAQQNIVNELKNSIESNTKSIKDSVGQLKVKVIQEATDKTKIINDSMEDLKILSEDIGKIISELQKKVSS